MPWCCSSRSVLGWETSGHHLIDCIREEALLGGSEMKGSGFYLAKKHDGITSSFVATGTNLITSYSMNWAEGGIESTGTQSVSFS